MSEKPQKSFVSEEEAQAATQENEVNELLQMSPLSRVVVCVEQATKELNLTRLALEKLVNVFTESKALAASVVSVNTPLKSNEPSVQNVGNNKIQELVQKIGPEMAQLVNFDTTTSNNFIIVKAKQFLGGGNWKKILDAVKELGGEYVSAGKDSHFRLPKLA